MEGKRLLLSLNNNIRYRDKTQKVVELLVDSGILIYKTRDIRNEDTETRLLNLDDTDNIWPLGPHLTALETVHWAVTFRCEDNCPDCYVGRHKHRFNSEMDT